MKLANPLANMRVARRLFVMFVVSAFIPLAAITFLSFTEVRRQVLQQGDQRLGASAKSYGMTVSERLMLAAEVAANAAAAGSRSSQNELTRTTFDSLALGTRDGETTTVFGRPGPFVLTPETKQRLAQAKPSVLVVGDGTATSPVRIAVAIVLASGAVAIGEVNPQFLWGLEDEWPAATTFCVFEHGSRRVLYCPEKLGEALIQAMELPGNAALSSANWTRASDQEKFHSRAWSQFLRAAFGAPDWVVVASQPESYHMARVRQFSRVYVPVVVLALLLVSWLTIRQSRNIVTPVTQLAERARGIASNDFRSRLGFRRKDEFGELADAFDRMSATLGRQFSSLTALSEIDRLILTAQDTVQIVRIVLQRLDDVVPSDFATITLFDNDDPDYATTYLRPVQAPDGAALARHRMADADRELLKTGAHDRRLDAEPGGSLPGYLALAHAQGIANVHVQPIMWRGEVCGALSLGFRAGLALTPEERQSARELADRLAVAVSSAWREEQLYTQAHFDPLSGLPNRLLFEDRLEREIARGQREALQFAVLFIDLDHFKNVNDSLGHGMGDTVLREAAKRIAACVRESDTVSRQGGDEFTVLATSLRHPQEAWRIAESIVAALSREFVLADQRCFLSASIGIASFPADGQTVEQLLKSADTAMYRAKASGRSQAVFFEERMNAETVSRLTLDRDLRVAMERGELVLHYQPQMDLRTGEICGAEALVRWWHPMHGLISPTRFIPLAEESGFIEQIGQWTLEQACAQMRSWKLEGVPIERVAVNVSPRQFRKRSLVDFIRRCVSEAALQPSNLEIEITEGLLVDRGQAVEGMLRELSAAGHKIALDDFGTGFSSMSYLKRFPVDAIKIDRVFIDGLERSADSEAIVAAIIAMSHALSKTVIAEGVETEEQLALLRTLRCDEIQGFLVSPAVPPAEFADLLRARARSKVSA